MDIVHFFVYRWPYLYLMSPEGFSVGQTPRAGIAEAGLTGIGVLDSKGAEHSPQVLGALLWALKPHTPSTVSPGGAHTCGRGPIWLISQYSLFSWPQHPGGGGDRKVGQKERKREIGLSPEAEWTPEKASLGKTTDLQFLPGQSTGLRTGHFPADISCLHTEKMSVARVCIQCRQHWV